jgi:hypothetical protein
MMLFACVQLLLFGAAGANAAQTFTDASGDAKGAAADVTQVAASNDFDGNLTFSITFANRTSLDPDDQLFIYLDADKNVSTGPNGTEYAIGVRSTGAELLQGTGSTFAPAPASTLGTADGGRTIRINRSDVGATTGFVFYVQSRLVSDGTASDDAPDRGAWAYDLELKPVLATLAARFSPAKPKAGKPFRLAATTLRVKDGTRVRADSITCVATLNGRRLAGRCSWRIPASARGKRLVVILTAHYKAAVATFTPWRFRVG